MVEINNIADLCEVMQKAIDDGEIVVTDRGETVDNVFLHLSENKKQITLDLD